jgi:ankyrin repeat protein
MLINGFPTLDINQTNEHGFTALMKAAIQGRTLCARQLLKAGMLLFSTH